MNIVNATAAIVYIACSYLFWVGYHWPDQQFEIRVKGNTAGVVDVTDNGSYEFSWTIDRHIQKLEEIRTKLYIEGKD